MHDAVELEALGERPGDVDGVATHQCVADQQGIGGLDVGRDRLELAHQRVVDCEASGRVVDDGVAAIALGLLRGGPADLGR